MMLQNNKSGVENGTKQWQLSTEHRWTGQHDKSPKERYRNGSLQQPRGDQITSPPAPKHVMGRPHRASNGYTGGPGPGMQAVFLGSKQSSGTGVFFPRREGTDAPVLPNKPACSPVLLPCRVVETLNLNVHEVGKQTKPKTDEPKKTAKRSGSWKKNRKPAADFEHICQDIYLPKEWTY